MPNAKQLFLVMKQALGFVANATIENWTARSVVWHTISRPRGHKNHTHPAGFPCRRKGIENMISAPMGFASLYPSCSFSQHAYGELNPKRF